MIKFFLFFLILFEAVINVNSYSNKCYKCASKHIQLNWNRYMPLQADSMRTIEVKDSKQCSGDNIPETGFNCNGPCMSINVTGNYNGKPSFFGTLRDCYSHYFRSPKLLMGDRECYIDQIKIKGNDYDAEYCFCTGDYCNGKQPIRASSRRDISPSSSATINSQTLILFNFVIAFVINSGVSYIYH